MHILETNKRGCFFGVCVCVCVGGGGGYLQQSASEPFINLCFEAGKWIALFYLG